MKTSRSCIFLVLALTGSIAFGNGNDSMGFTTFYAGGKVSGPVNLPGEITMSLNGQVVPLLSGQQTGSLPGQIVQPLPGQLIQSLHGQIVQALPDELLPWSPRYFKLRQNAQTELH